MTGSVQTFMQLESVWLQALERVPLKLVVCVKQQAAYKKDYVKREPDTRYERPTRAIAAYAAHHLNHKLLIDVNSKSFVKPFLLQ